MLQVSESYQIADGRDIVFSESILVSISIEYYKTEWDELIIQDDQQWEWASHSPLSLIRNVQAKAYRQSGAEIT